MNRLQGEWLLFFISPPTMGRMPELPEVEVVRTGLEPLVCGRRIRRVICRRPTLRYPLPPLDGLAGVQIMSLTRRAKYLLFGLERSQVLVWHLGMTGQFHLLPSATEPARHEHLRIDLDDDSSLCYRDARRFGYVGLLKDEELPIHPWFASLGPEPLSQDFSSGHLLYAVKGRRQPIKTLIMDARVVVGVGNIYACESLFRAGIHPATPARELNQGQLARLAAEIAEVLQEAIRAGGSSISDFVKVDGKPGYFAHDFRVYGRKGEPCRVCATPIARMVQLGRSTFFCPHCQPQVTG